MHGIKRPVAGPAPAEGNRVHVLKPPGRPSVPVRGQKLCITGLIPLRGVPCSHNIEISGTSAVWPQVLHHIPKLIRPEQAVESLRRPDGDNAVPSRRPPERRSVRPTPCNPYRNSRALDRHRLEQCLALDLFADCVVFAAIREWQARPQSGQDDLASRWAGRK